MSTKGPVIGKEDEFEGLYVERFRALVKCEGEFVKYDRDRAALDLGLHLTTPREDQRHLSHTRIWFQLKGIHKESLPLDEFRRAEHVSVTVRVDHLKFWYASPEPVYLSLYIESADAFLAEDVRELVHRRWGANFLAPDTLPAGQQEVTIRVRADSQLTAERLLQMRRHQSMRIDGPFFRGRALGHRLDPLRCSLGRLQPDVYGSLVRRLLQVHDYRPKESMSPKLLFPSPGHTGAHASLGIGKLYATLEWVSQLSTEFGLVL